MEILQMPQRNQLIEVHKPRLIFAENNRMERPCAACNGFGIPNIVEPLQRLHTLLSKLRKHAEQNFRRGLRIVYSPVMPKGYAIVIPDLVELKTLELF